MSPDGSKCNEPTAPENVLDHRTPTEQRTNDPRNAN